jgi:lipopolysaccharide transport system ATP-binding protein
MSDAIIKVEGVGKRYIISHEQSNSSYTALRDVISSKAKAVIKKSEQRPPKEEFWALKDVSFEINKGEAIGIIGRNGAGKSTLLKILSRITEPSTGRIELSGRVASLLEVGTGFHPELTGRENIFLNGAILGMSRTEILKKFDEIVDFSGVEKFLDTPVKRYSSGMYVRLAFAVAAHLEPEILIIDEVLAVGDAEFQAKCLGKMEKVSKGEGRTIIFVSHDLNAISTLTKKCILMEKGTVAYIGATGQAIKTYLNKGTSSSFEIAVKNLQHPHISSINLKTSEDSGVQHFGKPLGIEINLTLNEPTDALEISLQICDIFTMEPIVYNWFSTANDLASLKHKKGEFKIDISIPSLQLYKGEYFLKFYVSDPRGKIIYQVIEKALLFQVQMHGIYNEWGWQENVCKYIEKYNIQIS